MYVDRIYMQIKFIAVLLKYLRQTDAPNGLYINEESVMKHDSWLQAGSVYELIMLIGTFSFVLHQTSVPSPAAYDSSKNPKVP
jgi:hypothetical protein